MGISIIFVFVSYDYIHKGDLACFEYNVRSNRYERDGRTVYEQVLQVEQVTFKGNKRKEY
ncbi:MAG: hypothetical protein IJK56_04060 [Firmicutes bacterium]|nr:hypothetical protein [Bacillota bacterium]